MTTAKRGRGRPPSADPRRGLEVRLSAAELETLRAAAEEDGLAVSAFVREGALAYATQWERPRIDALEAAIERAAETLESAARSLRVALDEKRKG